jgi:DNA-binding Lrp family transcriptional regulator
MQDIDQRDRELLGALQSEVPLVSTPFAVIGQSLDMSEKEVIKRTERLKREGVIRHVCAGFDPRALGYRACLVAAKVDPEKIDQSAAAVTAHPGVTQNYRRNHEFNLWFTLSVAPNSRLGMERTIAILGEELDAAAIRPLPTLKLFRNHSHEMSADAHGDGANDHADDSQAAPLSDSEIEAVRLLQRDLPLQPRPFDTLARLQATLSPEELLKSARTFLKRQQMRKFAAVVASRKPGFSATAMGVWKVPADRADEYGTRMSAHRGVSHCYLRPVYEDWPFNLFTTVHGRSVDECESIIAELAAENGLSDGCALYPTKEYKQERLQLFAPDLEQWEAVHAGRQAESAAS